MAQGAANSIGQKILFALQAEAQGGGMRGSGGGGGGGGGGIATKLSDLKTMLYVPCCLTLCYVRALLDTPTPMCLCVCVL